MGFLHRIWRGERWPEEWKEEAIIPIAKGRKGKERKWRIIEG